MNTTPPSPSPDHIWTAIAITVLDEDQAAALAAMPMPDRLDDVAAIIGQRDPATLEGGPELVKGPTCKLCRVSYADVHRFPDEQWPCLGERPKALGGSIVQQGQEAVSRQDARKQRRAAQKADAAKVRAEQRASRPPPRGERRKPEPDKDMARAVGDALVRKRMSAKAEHSPAET